MFIWLRVFFLFFFSNLTEQLFLYSFYATAFINVIREPYLLLTNSSWFVCIAFVRVMHRGCLIWVKFVKTPKQKFESQPDVINPCSVIWKLYHKILQLNVPSRTPSIQTLTYVILVSVSECMLQTQSQLSN